MTNPQQIGPYKVLWRLGRGGMGAVYLCQHRDLGFRRAIKVLHTDGSESALDRFKKEAQVQAELDHPHLLKIEHSDLDQDGRAYVVMAYVGDDEGPMDLDRYLKDHGGKLDGRTTARLVGQILDGLAYAHGEGIVHRDLKPANILIEETPSGPMARIADFGLVRIVGEAAFRDRIFTSISQSLSLGTMPTIGADFGRRQEEDGTESPAGTGTRALIGTWSHMAPEQKCSGTDVDHRADVYSVGLMAYRMLAGALPEAITRLPGRTDSRLAAWDGWITRVLDGDPARRFQSAADARDALRTAARFQTVRPNRWIVALAAAAVIVAVGAGGFFIARMTESPTSDRTVSADEANIAAIDEATPQLPDQTAQLERQLTTCQDEATRLSSELARAVLEKGNAESSNRDLVALLQSWQTAPKTHPEPLAALEGTSIEAERRAIDLNDRVNELTAQVAVMLEQKRQTEQQINILRDENSKLARAARRPSSVVTEGGSTGPAMDGVQSTTPVAASPLRGRILEVSGAMVTLSLGAKDGVEEGMVFVVHRDDQYICDVKITIVDPENAAGRVISRRETPRPGDQVTDAVGLGASRG